MTVYHTEIALYKSLTFSSALRGHRYFIRLDQCTNSLKFLFYYNFNLFLIKTGNAQ